MNEKRPRMYAAEIMQMKSREERRKALEQVPEHLREWVKDYVITAFERKGK